MVIDLDQISIYLVKKGCPKIVVFLFEDSYKGLTIEQTDIKFVSFSIFWLKV